MNPSAQCSLLCSRWRICLHGIWLGGYSTRASNAAYCVADADKSPTKDVFRRFHSALFANQPAEGDPNAPDNDRLIEFARQAGVAGEVPGCIKSVTLYL